MPRAELYRLSTVILGCYSLALTSFVVARARRPDPNALLVEQLAVKDATAAHGGGVLQPGADTANVVTVWTDYQCPFCQKLETALDSLSPAVRARTRITIRHYPLSFHPNARALAALSICAEEVGRFAVVHRALFQRQGDTARLEPGTLPVGLGGADSTAMLACLASDRPQRRITADSLAAQRLRITGTPLVLVGRTLVHGAVGAATLDSLLARRGQPRVRG